MVYTLSSCDIWLNAAAFDRELGLLASPFNSEYVIVHWSMTCKSESNFSSIWIVFDCKTWKFYTLGTLHEIDNGTVLSAFWSHDGR